MGLSANAIPVLAYYTSLAQPDCDVSLGQALRHDHARSLSDRLPRIDGEPCRLGFRFGLSEVQRYVLLRPKELRIALGPLVRAFPGDRSGGKGIYARGCILQSFAYKVQRLETVEHVMEDALLAEFSYTTELHILAILLRIGTGYNCDTSHDLGTGDVQGCHSAGKERVTLATSGHV